MANLMPYLVPVLMVVGITLVITIIILQYLAEKKRTERLAEIAPDLGLDFSPTDRDNLMADLQAFRLYNSGHSRELFNVFRGEISEADVSIFDFKYTTGGGKSSNTHRQTVVCLELGFLLPPFKLRPEGMFDKIGSFLGFSDINLESYPEFSRRYFLLSSDEPAIHELFNDEIVTFFERRSGLWVESEGGTILVYRHGVRPEPGELRHLLEDALELAARLMASASDRRG